MPIVWRYVTKTYLKVFSLSLLTLFGLSFLIKHKKLTLLIVAGATYKQAFLLTLCMFLVTLPHIIGICSLISSFIASYKLQTSGEMDCLRASGLSFSEIFGPIYFAGGFLLLINIFLVSELVPYAKLFTNKLYLESQTINPLILLRKNGLPLLEDVYTEMHLDDQALESNNVLIAYLPPETERISLFVADTLRYVNKNLEGDTVSFISQAPSHADNFDHLFIDNQKHLSSPESLFISLIDKPSKAKDLEVVSLSALASYPSKEALQELLQRISKIVYPLTFTILAISAALVGKQYSYRRRIFFVAAIFFYFVSFFAIKKSFVSPLFSICLAIFPHFVIISFSLVKQYRFSRGSI